MSSYLVTRRVGLPATAKAVAPSAEVVDVAWAAADPGVEMRLAGLAMGAMEVRR